ncbi:N-6 DNA methylase [Opitutus sp. GAS368]|uniref:N-6 DNA methylase n=1 Tax=Opitutus sp. GAS368 TaxID=1882749 RepID=UPI00087B1438|nr:N-6 DNA methylase [Opitutus sp. GAS368]SDR81915.1 N-6 DNA Methylase [Opitutus sp. GAS368]
MNPRSTTTNKTTSSGRFIELDADKLRGGYYTSAQIAAWLCKWAIREKTEHVLEPSCGDGSFLVAAVDRLVELGLSNAAIASQVTGIEILGPEAEQARRRLHPILTSQAKGVVKTSDFFTWWQKSEQPAFDVVVGNPPFIRYQTFPEPHRSKAMTIMEGFGLTPNRLTNIWVPFVVAATMSIKPGGRMALVLPAELLQVTYAAQLRSFLTDHFGRIDIVACNELFFEKAEQEVVLLLADEALAKASEVNVCRVTMTETATVAEITRKTPASLLKSAQAKTISHDNEKWLKYFLSPQEIEFIRQLRSNKITTTMATHASVDVGVVTGKNEFFVLSEGQVKEMALFDYTTPLVSRSVQLKGTRIGKTDWKSLSEAGDRVYLLNIANGHTEKLPEKLRKYIRYGESKEFHKGYKCSIRKPWYAVPSIWTPDGFLFRQIYDFPRAVLNNTEATSTDTIHRISCKIAKPERIVANTYTWMTAASAEIEGRSYGGGVLELEPTEAERLLMPAELNGAMPLADADKLIRAGKLDSVLEANARIVLMQHMGMTARECSILRDIWIKMRDRRMARRRSVQNTDALTNV